jgi:hypothetical protein
MKLFEISYKYLIDGDFEQLTDTITIACTDKEDPKKVALKMLSDASVTDDTFFYDPGSVQVKEVEGEEHVLDARHVCL